MTSSSSSSLSSMTSGSRSILRVMKLQQQQSNYVVDLNATNFDTILNESPATYVVVEFFAHWCPVCRNYKPQYEKVAKLFNGANAVHPGIILLARVDCGNKINIKLCLKFHISHYPILLWGAPSKFMDCHWNGKREKSEIIPVADGRTADRLLKWINTKLTSSYRLEDEKFENEKFFQSNVSEPEQISRAIYDVEEATNAASDIITEHQMIKSDTRATFIKFLQIMVAHNPSRRCRKGTAKILVNIDDLYPSNNLLVNKDENTDTNGLDALHTFHICGKQVPRGYWMFCRGSRDNTRGFSCGLWVLLHSLSVRVDNEESQLAFTATCDFIHKFFICEECRQHFYKMCSSVTTPFNTTRDYALWLWSTHNKVNERVMKTESSFGTGDPKFPKIIWPPQQLCPSCYTNQTKNNVTNWDRNEVFKFLVNYYGPMLVSRYRDNDSVITSHVDTSSEDLLASRNSVAVPVGAAMAIGVASCLFGAMAYIWRSQQKSRKYF
ncbi:sulfhydryl oxidase 1-like [Bidens hawaiensis]|uniref:sulfhydryl oxidase 1-like n=1 Tax=Bidens hawaiensis TaxID=980011 RepID=UPI00404A0DC5